MRYDLHIYVVRRQSVNRLEPSGPHRPVIGIALPLLIILSLVYDLL